jgi:hypothetical protein
MVCTGIPIVRTENHRGNTGEDWGACAEAEPRRIGGRTVRDRWGNWGNWGIMVKSILTKPPIPTLTSRWSTIKTIKNPVKWWIKVDFLEQFGTLFESK